MIMTLSLLKFKVQNSDYNLKTYFIKLWLYNYCFTIEENVMIYMRFIILGKKTRIFKELLN